LLWTHFGVSGPVAMNASRIWHRAKLEGRCVEMHLNLLPGKPVPESWIARLVGEEPRKSLLNALATVVPARVADAILKLLEIDGGTPLAHLTRETRARLLRGLACWPLPVRDSRGYNYAEATAGGVALNEIDPATMASRKCPGLFLVGEILDVDGLIGGYNFQWAWSSAFVAAGGIERALGSSDREHG
jgi:predicted Rossmann fold flavoprotein